MNSELIKEIVEEYAYMWTTKKDEYVLVRMPGRYQTYHIPTQGVGGTELEEVNRIIWQNMIDAEVKILDHFPNIFVSNILILQYWFRKTKAKMLQTGKSL